MTTDLTEIPDSGVFHLTKKPIVTALAMSIKKADTSGRMMKEVGAAPGSFETVFNASKQPHSD
ncbi:MAG: hypothetical protein JO271_15375 [Verrucomicrobia bacterium]|nr:hypothetical protein [Verrucomicrobiota bacterium]MBV9274746.1 hypothetical protein [Verrucomicrobiota bacterium]